MNKDAALRFTLAVISAMLAWYSFTREAPVNTIFSSAGNNITTDHTYDPDQVWTSDSNPGGDWFNNSDYDGGGDWDDGGGWDTDSGDSGSW